MARLDDLRNDAKRWLKRLREHNVDALTRLKRAYPGASNSPTLRDVQHALAREQGYENWIALKAGIEALQPEWWRVGMFENAATRAARFLDVACWDHRTHGRSAYTMRTAAAVTLLRKHPELRRHDLYTAIVCGETDAVARILDAQPDLVNQKGGWRRWEPLLYLTYARVPADVVGTSAVRTATLLLDRGADANAYYMAGDACYSALVGVAGEGEQDAPPHAERDQLYALLLDRGAAPFDMQVLYNTHFGGEVLWWLELTYNHSVRHGRTAAWNDPEWQMFDMRAYGSGARFVLWLAIRKNDVGLAQWALEHGANANAAPAPHPEWPKRSLYDEAIRAGCSEIATLLLRHGAKADVEPLTGEAAYTSACLLGDRHAAIAQLQQHPDLAHSPKALFEAARRNDTEAVELLLGLGTPINLQDEERQTALHVAAASDARDVVNLLLSRGADPDVRERRWNSTPLGFASHHGHEAIIDLLVPVSTDVWNLTNLGRIDRLRQVLAASPELAREVRDEVTPLFWLPSDDQQALQAVELLLGHGANAARQSADGRVAADVAQARGLDAAAVRLTAAAGAPRIERS